MKTHQWNTGRHYDQHGQRMVARYDSNNHRILFSDLSRNINGYIRTHIAGNILFSDWAMDFTEKGESK